MKSLAQLTWTLQRSLPLSCQPNRHQSVSEAADILGSSIFGKPSNVNSQLGGIVYKGLALMSGLIITQGIGPYINKDLGLKD